MASPSPQPQDDLPPPWIREYDPQYKTFFYVNPTTEPPTTTWTRPGFPEGQIHPEQAHALQTAQHVQGGGAGGGEAALYMNAQSTDTPVYHPPAGAGATGDPNQNQNQVGYQGQGQGQDSEKGLGSMIGSVMGGGSNQYANQQQYGYQQQQYGNQQYGYQQPQQQQSSSKFGALGGLAAGGIGGLLLGELLGKHSGNSGRFGHNMGAPPFMGGGGGGMFGGGGGGFGGPGGMMGGMGGHHGGGHHGGGGFGGGGFGGGGGGFGGPGGGGGGGRW